MCKRNNIYEFDPRIFCKRNIQIVKATHTSADFLANFGHAGSFQWSFIDYAPLSLGLIFFEDSVGCSLPRAVRCLVFVLIPLLLNSLILSSCQKNYLILS